MRGQKSKSSPGVRRGFEGGQMPLYRQIPKLRGIAGGMHAGLPKYVPVNLKDIAEAGFQEGEEVLLETLKKKGLINPSGREKKNPFKACFRGCATVSARQLRDALLKKVARRKVLRLQAQKDRSSVVDELRQELREYREIVKYNICLDPPKEVVITKCYHLFCNPCSKNYRKLSSQVSGLCCKFWP